MRNGKQTAPSVDASGAPIDELPDWARDQLQTAALFILPKEADPDAEALIEHVRFLEAELTAASERLAHGNSGEKRREDVAYAPFPLDALPETLSAYVRASAEAIPCAPAMVAVPLLAVLSGAVGAAARLRLKRTWKEVPILWTAVVAPSGSAKSPAAEHALRPVYRREQHAAERYEYELERYEEAQEAGHEATRPVRERYRVGDVTREKVAQVLSENRRGVLLVQDELATWLGSFDRYANGSADLHAWLAFYEARQVTVDRVSRDNVTLSSPAVAVTGTIQPGTLQSKLAELHFDTGFAQRLMLCMPPAKPRVWTEADVTQEVESGYERVLEGLYGIPMGTTVKLSQQAKKTWIEWYNATSRTVACTPEGPARAVASKTIGHAARLTLLLHLAGRAEKAQPEDDSLDWGKRPVKETTVRHATRLAAWLRNETLRVYHELDLTVNAVPPLMRFCYRLPSEFRTSEAEEIAREDGIPRRTMFDWLTRLQERGEIEKVKRGLYRKR